MQIGIYGLSVMKLNLNGNFKLDLELAKMSHLLFNSLDIIGVYNLLNFMILYLYHCYYINFHHVPMPLWLFYLVSLPFLFLL